MARRHADRFPDRVCFEIGWCDVNPTRSRTHENNPHRCEPCKARVMVNTPRVKSTPAALRLCQEDCTCDPIMIHRGFTRVEEPARMLAPREDRETAIRTWKLVDRPLYEALY